MFTVTGTNIAAAILPKVAKVAPATRVRATHVRAMDWRARDRVKSMCRASLCPACPPDRLASQSSSSVWNRAAYSPPCAAVPPVRHAQTLSHASCGRCFQSKNQPTPASPGSGPSLIVLIDQDKPQNGDCRTEEIVSPHLSAMGGKLPLAGDENLRRTSSKRSQGPRLASSLGSPLWSHAFTDRRHLAPSGGLG